MCMEQYSITTLNSMILEDLITEDIITGRDRLCGKWLNVESFPPKPPIKPICDKYFCPVCGFEKVNTIRKRVSFQTNEFQKNDGILHLLTLTIPHSKDTQLEEMYELLSQSTRRLKNSSVWRNRLKKELNSQFHYNRYETTITPSNSFHLHLHITLGGYNIIDTDLWKERLTEVWRRCCDSVGVKKLPSNKRGVDIRVITNGTYTMKLNEDTNIPKKQDSYSVEDLKKILTGYKRIEHFKHQDFSLNEIKKYLKKYKRVFQGKKYMKVYFDNEDYRWKWSEEQRTLEGLFV